MRRAGGTLWSLSRAAWQSQSRTRPHARLPVVRFQDAQDHGSSFLQVSRCYSLNGGGSSWMVPWQGRAFRHASTAATEDSKPAEEVADGITLTDNCIRRIQEIKLEDGPEGENKMLRLSVEGGGCSGFLYNFALDDKVNKDDRVFGRDGAKLVVDDISFGFIKGATVDFTEELIRASFAVTINPNAASACGCGASFNAK